MIKLYCTDALSFDLANLEGKKIDLIFTNPPAFNPNKPLFANNIDQHVARMLTWFRLVMEQTNIPLAFIHLTSEYFIHMISGHEKIIKFPVEETRYKASKWYTISENSLEAFFKKHLKYSRGKTLLDLFCGTGRILSVANKFGMDGIGIDNDPEELKIFKKEMEAINGTFFPETNR